MDSSSQAIFSVLIGIPLLIWILTNPYVGIVIILISLPVIDLLPEVPFLTSIIIPFGAATFVGFLFSKKNRKIKSPYYWGPVQVTSIFFILWVFISNPVAALFGPARNWILTFFQCWILLWLSSNLMDTFAKQRTFMWLFSIVCVVSAIFAISQGQIGSTLSDSIRAGGLANQPNITARYLVIAFVFLTYLLSSTRKPFLRVLIILGIVITFIGVFFTLSRTGIVLLIVAVGLLIFSSGNKRALVIFLVVGFATFLLINFSSGIVDILNTILPSIEQGGNTVGLRYSLWQAGWRMWLDHPVTGVGIGLFTENLPTYAYELPAWRWNLVAHNTYVSILAETGLVGLVLFVSMIFFSLRNFLAINKGWSAEILSLRNTWLIVFITILIGSVTKNDHYEKFFWFIMGISVFFQNYYKESSKAEPVLVQDESSDLSNAN